ncbi:hypothetical protein K461DRAFT_271074 [Myriangium duriaei CBS 260.36]|uniref:Uncharacterized protein n=1 Tax=Myriangium duriaei CBS 260.36 TaxID=1168546 RepID=A0A9P4IVY3_9PEZI|nr:hypothetical protein K461DRAFT_271074 [Myriangium duriaei CBS 260.36]
MTTRMTRVAAAAAAAQTDLDAAADITLPSSPAVSIQLGSSTNTPAIGSFASSVNAKRSASGSKTATVLIAEDSDADTAMPARPGSPTALAPSMVLKPRSKANQLLAKERAGMRASSNKENMTPEGAQEAVGGNVLVTGRMVESSAGEAQAEAVVPGETTVVLPAETQTVEVKADEQASNKAEPITEPTPTATITKEQASTQDEPAAPKPSRRTSQAPNRRTSTAPTTKPAPARRSSAIIPHSAPRPMSMSFPPPPGPIKSSKPATRPTFALPGEAVAARLKAAKEARLANSTPAEEPKRPAFKARPAPKMVVDTSKVRQTAASRAREGLMHPSRIVEDKEKQKDKTRRATIVVEQRTRTTRPMSVVVPAAGRRVSVPAGGVRSEKGREVYNRAAAGVAEQVKAKKDKDEAARKARAEAAERGRVLSREWAEKQKAKAGRKSRVSEVGQ